MPLTPSDVSNKLFGRQVRGYSLDEVDNFLDEVESELTRLLTENAALNLRLAAVPAPTPSATPAPAVQSEPPTPDPASAPVQVAAQSQDAALRTLLMAQRTADQAIAEARAEADQLLRESRTQADKLLGDSEARSTQIQQEINDRTASALAELAARRTELEARIEDLRAFEREYRLRLRAYLEAQLDDLDVRGGGMPSEGAGAGVPAAARTAAVGIMPSGVTDSAAARPAPVVEGFPQVLAPEAADLKVTDSRRPTGGGALPRAVPPLSDKAAPMSPFTVVPPPVQLEQDDEGPEPPPHD